MQERKETREKTRMDKLAGYFFDLSKLIFAALALGGITPVLADAPVTISWVTILLGVFSTYAFAALANRTLK